MWHSEGQKVNPADGTVLADSGLMNAHVGRKLAPGLIVSSEQDANVVLLHRNAADNGNVWYQGFAIAGRRPFFLASCGAVALAPGERFRIETVGAVAGRIQATLIMCCDGPA